jgi:hypothetical protein
MTKEELKILEYVRQDIRDVREDISNLHKKLDNHMNGDCSTQRELTEHKNKDHKLMWTFILGLPALIGIIVTLIEFLR